jgi:hypothetical protein
MATAILIMRGQMLYIADGSQVSVMLPEICSNGTTVVPVPTPAPLKSLATKKIYGGELELDELGGKLS